MMTLLARHPRVLGVTLAELLISLAMSAALAVAAWPTLTAMLAQQRVAQAADRLAASLALARSTAAARRTEVRLGPIGDAYNLDRGWQLTALTNEPDGQATPFSVVALNDRCLRITLRGTGVAASTQSLRLTAVGYSRSERGGFIAVTFQVHCDQARRQVRLGAQGRIRICRPGVDADCG